MLASSRASARKEYEMRISNGFAGQVAMTTTYYITASAYMHQNLFQRTETADLLLSTLFRYRDACEFLLHEFVIMPNPVHLLLSVEEGCAVGRAMQLVKGVFSHSIRQSGLKLKTVWQPSYYEHRVCDAVEYGRIRTCIHENPVPGPWSRRLRNTRIPQLTQFIVWTKYPRG